MSFLAKHGSDLLGAGIVSLVGFGLYKEYQKSIAAATPVGGLPSASSTKPVGKDMSREYLKSLASSGDELAKSTLQVATPQAVVSAQVRTEVSQVRYDLEPLRFDVSSAGLQHGLQIVLDAKRKYEKQLLEEYKRKGYPAGFEDTLRNLRQEREEVKQLLKALNKKESKSWWWF